VFISKSWKFFRWENGDFENILLRREEKKVYIKADTHIAMAQQTKHKCIYTHTECCPCVCVWCWLKEDRPSGPENSWHLPTTRMVFFLSSHTSSSSSFISKKNLLIF
jgi:hypothetical protein